MTTLLEILRGFRAKPRAFHVGLVLVLAWVPLLLHMAGHPFLAMLALLLMTAAFLVIHPLGALAAPPPDPAASHAANDEVIP